PWEPDDKHAQMYDDVDIREPDTFNDDYSTRSDAAREATMRIDRNLNRTDLKVTPPAGLRGKEQIGRASCRERGERREGEEAEDGIRDFHVTGVQTCALPICPGNRMTSTRRCTMTWIFVNLTRSMTITARDPMRRGKRRCELIATSTAPI